MPRSLEDQSKGGSLVAQLVEVGALKPTDEFVMAGEDETGRLRNAVWHAIDDGIEKLLMRDSFVHIENVCPLYCHEKSPGKFTFAAYPGGIMEPTDLQPLFEFLGRKLQYELGSEAPLPMAWLAWVINTHEIICHPDTTWDFWTKEWLDPGTMDWDSGNWHEMEKGAEADKRLKTFRDEFILLKKHYPFLVRTTNQEDNTGRALAAFKRIDPKLADIVQRLHAGRGREHRGDIDIHEPFQTYTWGRKGSVLSHCVDFIQYNLHEGNMQQDEPFFTIDCTIPQMSGLADKLEAMCAPVFELDRYIWKLSKPKQNG